VIRGPVFCAMLYVWSCLNWGDTGPGFIKQGSHKPRKTGIVREFCKPGKIREFEMWSGNFFYDMSHGSRLAYRWVDPCM